MFFQLAAAQYALYVAAKNVWYSAIALPVALVPAILASAELPDLSINAAFWGAVGGLCRWLSCALPFRPGLSGLLVGLMTATAFNGARIEMFHKFIEMEGPIERTIQALIIGGFAAIIWGFGDDFWKAYTKRIIEK